MVSAPVLVTLTDRVDAKRVYLFGVACSVLGHAAFGAIADRIGLAGAFSRHHVVPDMTVHQTGKSAAIRLTVDAFYGRSDDGVWISSGNSTDREGLTPVTDIMR